MRRGYITILCRSCTCIAAGSCRCRHQWKRASALRRLFPSGTRTTLTSLVCAQDSRGKGNNMQLNSVTVNPNGYLSFNGVNSYANRSSLAAGTLGSTNGQVWTGAQRACMQLASTGGSVLCGRQLECPFILLLKQQPVPCPAMPCRCHVVQVGDKLSKLGTCHWRRSAVCGVCCTSLNLPPVAAKLPHEIPWVAFQRCAPSN